MRNRNLARVLFGLTALLVLVGLVVETVVAAGNTAGHFQTPGARVANLFCFFTIESSVLVLVTTALLAIDPTRDGPVFRVFRLAGLIGIVVTGVVYHLVLAGLTDLSGAAAFSNLLLHTFSPLLCVLGWLLFGPRGGVDWPVIGLALLHPALWLVLTLVRGPLVDFYPYPFVDVPALGYPRVLLNCLLVAVLYLGLAAAARAVDRSLTSRVPVG